MTSLKRTCLFFLLGTAIALSHALDIGNRDVDQSELGVNTECECLRSLAVEFDVGKQLLLSELVREEIDASHMLSVFLMHMGRFEDAEYILRSLLLDCPVEIAAEGGFCAENLFEMLSCVLRRLYNPRSFIAVRWTLGTLFKNTNRAPLASIHFSVAEQFSLEQKQQSKFTTYALFLRLFILFII